MAGAGFALFFEPGGRPRPRPGVLLPAGVPVRLAWSRSHVACSPAVSFPVDALFLAPGGRPRPRPAPAGFAFAGVLFFAGLLFDAPGGRPRGRPVVGFGFAGGGGFLVQVADASLTASRYGMLCFAAYAFT